jgi:hypothetical protein
MLAEEMSEDIGGESKQEGKEHKEKCVKLKKEGTIPNLRDEATGGSFQSTPTVVFSLANLACMTTPYYFDFLWLVSASVAGECCLTSSRAKGMPEQKGRREWDRLGQRGVSCQLLCGTPILKIIGASGPDQTRPECHVSGELQYGVHRFLGGCLYRQTQVSHF